MGCPPRREAGLHGPRTGPGSHRERHVLRHRANRLRRRPARYDARREPTRATRSSPTAASSRRQPADAGRRLGRHPRGHHRAPPAEMERDRSQAFANTVIENVPATIVVKDAHDLRYVLINRAGEQFFGMPRDAHDRQDRRRGFRRRTTAATIAESRPAICWRPTGKMIYDEHPVTTPGPATHRHHHRGMPIRGDDGDAALSAHRDPGPSPSASAPRRSIAHLAHHDSLTDLPNRAAFTACFDFDDRDGAADGAGRSRCCGSTSTASRRSTTSSATRPATSCCGRSPSACRPRSAAPSWRGSAATNSP